MLKIFIVTVDLVNYTNVFKEKGKMGRRKATKLFNQLNQKVKGFDKELNIPEELLVKLNDLSKNADTSKENDE